MTATKTFHGTREEWLGAIVEELREDFRDVGLEIPHARYSIGYTGSRERAGSHVLAACWDGAASNDGAREIFVVPELDDSERIVDVMVHELIHACLPHGEGHKAMTYGKFARALGLEGKLTATYAGDDLRWRAANIIRKVGGIPHAALNGGRVKIPPRRPGEEPTGPQMPRQVPKQGTRNLKVQCTNPDCHVDENGVHTQCVVRMTRRWLDIHGPPTCGCGHPMAEVEPPPETEETKS